MLDPLTQLARRPAIRRRGGFTLLEATIAITLLGIVGGAITLASKSSSDAMRTGSFLAEFDVQGAAAIKRIAESLSEATRDDVLPAAPAAVAPLSTTQLDFQTSEFVAPAVVLSDWARVGFEYEGEELDDGLDNNGNGLVDEGIVVLTEDRGLATERRVVLCRSVSEFLEGEEGDNGLDDNGNGLRDEGGLSFDFEGDRVTIRLTLQREGPGRFLITRSFEKTVALRR